MLKSIDIEILERESLYITLENFGSMNMSISRDDRYLVFGYSEVVNVSMAKGRIYSDMLGHFYLRLRSVVLRFDSDKGEILPFWG
ncbi:MAG: hypothetical protein QXQ29_04145 [Candidatus Bathyarchaeia archaeon]